MKFRPCIRKSHWNLPAPAIGINLPIPEQLLRWLEKTGVQVTHQDLSFSWQFMKAKQPRKIH